MKSFFITLIFLISITQLFSQKKMQLDNCKKLETNYSDNDSTRIYSINSISNLKVITNARLDESFIIEDTLHRDYLETTSKKLTLDYLYGLRQNDYTGAYDFMECFFLQNINHNYCVLSFVDVFILGTNQQVFYVVLESASNKNEWSFHSSYENEHNMPTDDIRIIKKKKGIKLKGRYLKKIEV